MFSGACLGIRATPQLSPTLLNYTCLASHLPRSILCNVSHAWRSVCVYVCLCGCIYIQTGIEGTVTHSLCSLFLPHNLPTHPLPISKKKKRKSISLDISQLYKAVIISLHLPHQNQQHFFPRMMFKINITSLIIFSQMLQGEIVEWIKGSLDIFSRHFLYNLCFLCSSPESSNYWLSTRQSPKCCFLQSQALECKINHKTSVKIAKCFFYMYLKLLNTKGKQALEQSNVFLGAFWVTGYSLSDSDHFSS